MSTRTTTESSFPQRKHCHYLFSHLLWPATRGIPFPFFGLCSLYFNCKECCFLGQTVFSFSLFSLLDFPLPSFPFETVFGIYFLFTPLLKKHIQTEKKTQALWKISIIEEKRISSEISQGIKEYLSTVFTEYSQRHY